MDIPNSVNKFTEFAKKCASRSYSENSEKWNLAWKSIKFGMGCNITKEYWQQGMYSEEDVRKLLNQCNTLSTCESNFNEQDWFDKIKK